MVHNINIDPVEGVRHRCPCCFYLTLPSRGWYEICPVCGWEDTGQDDHDADDYRGGPNRVTLAEARRNFAEIGASEPRRVGRVRLPSPDEIPPADQP